MEYNPNLKGWQHIKQNVLPAVNEKARKLVTRIEEIARGAEAKYPFVKTSREYILSGAGRLRNYGVQLAAGVGLDELRTSYDNLSRKARMAFLGTSLAGVLAAYAIGSIQRTSYASQESTGTGAATSPVSITATKQDASGTKACEPLDARLVKMGFFDLRCTDAVGLKIENNFASPEKLLGSRLVGRNSKRGLETGILYNSEPMKTKESTYEGTLRVVSPFR